MTYGDNKETTGEKILFIGVILALVLLFVVLMRPIYDSENMIAEFKSDCDKRGGVMLEHKKLLGTSYECASRLDV